MRSDYYELLQAPRSKDSSSSQAGWHDSVIDFLRGMPHQSEDTLSRVERINATEILAILDEPPVLNELRAHLE